MSADGNATYKRILRAAYVDRYARVLICWPDNCIDTVLSNFHLVSLEPNLALPTQIRAALMEGSGLIVLLLVLE